MTQDFKDMAYLFSCGARGITPRAPHKLNLHGIYEKAVAQNVWPTVFLAVRQLYENNGIALDESQYQKWKLEFLDLATRATRKDMAVFNTIKLLNDHGADCQILKGAAVARLYHVPVCRVSSDTDLLIAREQEKKVCRLLKKNGYTVERRPANEYHVNCYHPAAGTVEVHVALYSDATDDIVLNRQVQYTQEPILVTYDGAYQFKTLGVYDGLMYLTVHFIKHFVNKGAGIRQIMDLLLYAAHYKAEIDWEKYMRTMKALKYDKLFENLIELGHCVLHFGRDELYSLAPPLAPRNNCVERIMTDIEEGGIFGHMDNARAEFYKFYALSRFAAFKSGDFTKYMSKHHQKELLIRLFPNYRMMADICPYIRKRPALLPVAWLQRWARLLWGVLRGRAALHRYTRYTLPEENDRINERMALIRALDMV